ncbi:MAG TPA: FAD-linked oxidase C-terminal domain-containing protein [Vicinamibacterales bacterium]|nr:FAD-linked oxidase C-terminal domain-containing protein [Vicinamibacterales bacterium]
MSDSPAAALQRALEQQIEGEVRFDRVSRALYSTDASVYQIVPAGVVVPRTREDLVRIVAIAGEHGMSITARGGGTSQAGQAVGAGLQVDTSKYLNRILEIDPAARSAWVEPGVVLDELNAALKPHGLRFAPDISTASRATIGGMIANNSSGARSVMYGKTIDHVRELHVVLADAATAHFRPLTGPELAAARGGTSLESTCYRIVGDLAESMKEEIDRRFPKVLRRVGGYNLDEFVEASRPFNLSKLIVGSEGTLALVAAARVALVPLPAAKAVLAIEFEDLLDALAATPMILEHRPSAIEVMDRFILDHARESPALDALRRSVLVSEPGALLCVELYADDAGDLPPRLDRLEQALARSGLRCRWRRATTAVEQGRIWSLREAALGLSMAMKGDAKSLSFVEDTAVAPARLRDYIERFLGIVRAHGTVAGVYAHASVGCLHVRPVVDLKTDEGVARFEAIASAVADLVLEFGGALSGEHGDGLVRGPFTRKMFGPDLYEAFRTIKRTFDPAGLFNPGKIVDAPPLTANLRFGAGYRTPDPPAQFDYEPYGGFGRAVEMCSGLGVCRKTLEGTMCPSYMATREEKHSTRGRANVLRLAMAGRLGEEGLVDDEVRDVLDLCLECRACKAECPVGVDVARFKSEFLAQYWQARGTPLGARAIGHVAALAKWGSRLAPLSNWLAATPPARRMAEAWLGIDRRRTLPVWQRDTFARRFGRRVSALSPASQTAGAASPTSASSQSRPRIVLFNDTFTNHMNPEIGVAAVDVLRAAGVEPRLVPHGCCGRPLISQGLLDDARRLAALNAGALYAAAAAGEAIVFLEPSCLSAVKEDAPDLLRGDAQRRARIVGQACTLFEAFVESRWQGGAALPLGEGPKTIVLHGHCHQKAMGLLPAARTLLARVPGAACVDLDAGCCGMAGSFGYARDHYDLSRQIGERRLLPAARTLGPGAVLVASGVSCRQQVAHFTGVAAAHPAALLRSLLEDPDDRARLRFPPD